MSMQSLYDFYDDVNEENEGKYLREIYAEQGYSIKGIHEPSMEESIHEAARNGHAGIIQEWLNRGVSIDVYDENHETQAYSALSNLKVDTFEALVLAGADVNAKDAYGSTLFQNAFVFISDYPFFDLIVEEMVQRGADTNVKDETGYTVLQNIDLFPYEDEEEKEEVRYILQNADKIRAEYLAKQAKIQQPVKVATHNATVDVNQNIKQNG